MAGKCTSSGPIKTDLVDDASVFTVSIDGKVYLNCNPHIFGFIGYEQETPASFGLHLHANPTFKQCSSKTSPKDVQVVFRFIFSLIARLFQYEWKLNGEGQLFDDGLKLPAYSYSVDELVNITLIARYNHEKLSYSSSTTKTIHVCFLHLKCSHYFCNSSTLVCLFLSHWIVWNVKQGKIIIWSYVYLL